MDTVHAEEDTKENSPPLKIHQLDKTSSQVAEGRIYNDIHSLCYQISDILGCRIIA